ncbi:MAG TPA: VTT domain-containing protein [archaeon]|nr:VTT domain-containing protein [archaeon]
MKNVMKKNHLEGVWYRAFIFLLIFILLWFIYFVVAFKIDLIAITQDLVLRYGLIGLFVGSIVANASLFLVVPIDLVVLIVAGVFHPIVLALVVGIGAALGEFSGYIVGLGGREALKKISKKDMDKISQIKDKLNSRGFILIILGAFTPFPFDIIGISAGIIRYDVYKFFLGAFIGKFFRYLLIAYAGIFGIAIIKSFFGLP